MLLDNEKNKAHNYICDYVEEGNFDVVTGYFTVGALVHIANKINKKIKEFRFVLGDIVNVDLPESRAIDLLNETISINAALKLNVVAKEAVEFLRQEKVLTKTLEPNFCHAKLYLFNPENNNDRNKFFITGSSNLTEAGIGLKPTHNIELNIAETGNNGQYKELADWFNELWLKPQAHTEKTLTDEKGKKYKKPFKEYLIEEIEKLFIEYTPNQLYYKVLYELFGEQVQSEKDNPDFSRQVGKLENTVIYNSLYEFQKKGVLSLIKMLQKYNGAILADAVGLGKTWSALAVMKFFQQQRYEIILFCPKKLQHNWHRYLKRQNSKFETDKLDFDIRFHTDLHKDLLKKYKDRADKFFANDSPKLFVIDESHNLRNDKSGRYQFLLNEILQKNDDAKVLMLSATPINNSLSDIRNQFKLMVKGNASGFSDSLDIKNIDFTFRKAKSAFDIWRSKPKPQISEFIKLLPANFFVLTDALIVARTRKMIEGQQTGLDFPAKAKPVNLFITPKQLGNFESFEELFQHFPPMLSGYQPSFYIIQQAGIAKTEDEQQRDKFLVKMMYILMVKRLESSWYSFYLTVSKILAHHQNAYDKIIQFQQRQKDSDTGDVTQISLFEDDELEDEMQELTLGKKRPIKLSEIFRAGKLEAYKTDLKTDIESLDLIVSNLKKFGEAQQKEIKRPNNHKSKDDKLEMLIDTIKEKRKSSKNDDNQKLVIFTVYRDTAYYLYEQLAARGFNKIAVVSGGGSKADSIHGETKNFEPILERFAPYTKLYREKEWPGFQATSTDISLRDQFYEWIEWIANADPATYEQVINPIDILIATDTLSEGQNLQDCDTVINYDIHWNPVRIIQRMGRIDRLGSLNNEIYGINFWPSNNINTYLNLQSRIEERMATMKLAGAEVHMQFSKSFEEMATDENLENKMKARMMEQMQTSWDDIEISEQGLGFDNLSLEGFRQDLLTEINKSNDLYKNMPKAVFTGFAGRKEKGADTMGIIAFMGSPAKQVNSPHHRYQHYYLIYLDKKGQEVVLNQKEVLDILASHKDELRTVAKNIDKGEPAAIEQLSLALTTWLKSQAVEEELQEDGTLKQKMGKEPMDILNKLKIGSKAAIEKLKSDGPASQKFSNNNIDLITWFIVS